MSSYKYPSCETEIKYSHLEGEECRQLHVSKIKPVNISVPEILEGMAATFKERNSKYKDNYKMVAKIIDILFPDGVPSDLVLTDQWHLFELKINKLTRFATSNLTHIDSMHDDAIYSAMIEMILTNGETK